MTTPDTLEAAVRESDRVAHLSAADRAERIFRPFIDAAVDEALEKCKPLIDWMRESSHPTVIQLLKEYDAAIPPSGARR